MKIFVIVRRLCQIFFLGLFVYILWSTTYPLKGVIPADAFFKANPLIMLITSISERLILPGIAASIVMLALTFIFGRFYCGWICPLGSMIDASGAFRKNKNPLNDNANAFFRKIKHVILAGIFAGGLMGVQLAWPFDPMVIAARFISLNLIPTATLLIERSFIFLIRDVGLNDQLYPVYQMLKNSILGVKEVYFSHAAIIFGLFAAIMIAAAVLPRSWCRGVCPLGAVYALVSKIALFGRGVKSCVHCGRCKSPCRMGAIKDGDVYVKSECVLCMDCLYTCSEKRTSFSFWHGPALKTANEEKPAKGISRQQFFLIIGAAFASLAFRKRASSDSATAGAVIRPPASLKEHDFLNRCVRCGNCMKVCPTNGLQPVLMETGLEGMWTPRLAPDIGYCEFNCTQCGNVCPTGAINKLTLEEKHKTKLGTAVVDPNICIAWAENKQCLVCEEHCPVPDKAIKADVYIYGRPVVIAEKCVGCGICQTKCPVRPDRAIKVSPKGEVRR